MNSSYFKTIHWILNWAVDVLRKGYIVSKKHLTKQELKDFLYGLGFTKDAISCNDGDYYATTWQKVGEIIDYDLIDTMVYKADTSDCDNFAYMFASRAGFIYGINTFAKASGEVFNKDTGVKLGNHAFNLIVTKEPDGQLYAYCYEPMSDQQALITDLNNVVIGSWRYQINWMTFY